VRRSAISRPGDVHKALFCQRAGVVSGSQLLCMLIASKLVEVEVSVGSHAQP
jgi:hypothetical protein